MPASNALVAKAVAQGRINNGNDSFIPLSAQLDEARDVICRRGVRVY